MLKAALILIALLASLLAIRGKTWDDSIDSSWRRKITGVGWATAICLLLTGILTWADFQLTDREAKAEIEDLRDRLRTATDELDKLRAQMDLVHSLLGATSGAQKKSFEDLLDRTQGVSRHLEDYEKQLDSSQRSLMESLSDSEKSLENSLGRTEGLVHRIQPAFVESLIEVLASVTRIKGQVFHETTGALTKVGLSLEPGDVVSWQTNCHESSLTFQFMGDEDASWGSAYEAASAEWIEGTKGEIIVPNYKDAEDRELYFGLRCRRRLRQEPRVWFVVRGLPSQAEKQQLRKLLAGNDQGAVE